MLKINQNRKSIMSVLVILHIFLHLQIDIYDILKNRQTYEMNIYFNEQSLERSLYVERDPELPPIGTRVRRGPSWPYTNQDSHVAGTIIGHWDQRNVTVIEINH